MTILFKQKISKFITKSCSLFSLTRKIKDIQGYITVYRANEHNVVYVNVNIYICIYVSVYGKIQLCTFEMFSMLRKKKCKIFKQIYPKRQTDIQT